MNGKFKYRCVALLPFFVLMVVPGRLPAEDGESVNHDSVTKSSFGKLPDSTEIDQYTLTNSKGAVAKVITGSHCSGYLFFRLLPKGVAS